MAKTYRLLLSALFALVCAGLPAYAAGEDAGDLTEDQIRELVEESISCNNNLGNEFWMSFPPCYEQGGNDNQLVLYISSQVETNVKVEIPGRGVVKTQKTVPNDIIFFSLSPAEGQPFNKSPNQAAPSQDLYTGAGVHVIADDPVVVYGVTRFQFTSDSFLAIPVNSLGTEYVVSAYADMSAMYPGFNLPSETTITAAYDDTKVFFTLGGNALTTTNNGMTEGKTRSYTLNKGDVVAISSVTSEGDVSGSYVRSTKPVAVVSGNQCANVPTIIRWCDYIVEMQQPMHAWSTAYHVPSFATRQHTPYVKVYAKKPGTVVWMDNTQFGIIEKGKGGSEGLGFIHKPVADGEPTPHVIWSEDPIYVEVFNRGQEADNITSDPFQMTMTPSDQYQKEIVFNTPGVAQLQFAKNWANIVYELDENGVVPDDLEMAVVSGGEFTWSRVKDTYGSTPGYVFVKEINGKKYAMKSIELPDPAGVYKLRADKPIACYINGAQDYDTYGHPASIALRDLENVEDEDKPVVTYTVGCDGNVEDGIVRDKPEDDAIRSNMARIFMVKDFSCNYELTYEEFVPGQANQVEWQLRVIDPKQSGRAVVVFTDRNCNFETVIVEYDAFNVAIVEEETDFGKFKPGDSRVETVKVINMNPTGPVTIERLELRDGAQGFEILNSSPALPATLEAYDVNSPDEGAHIMTVSVQFTGSESGEFEDVVVAGNECQEVEGVVLAEVGNLEIVVDNYSFGQVNVNLTTRWVDVLVKNTGSSDLTITEIQDAANTANWEFDWASGVNDAGVSFADIISGAATEMVIGVGDGVAFKARFTPTDAVTYSHVVTFISDAGTVKDNLAELDGEGITSDLILEVVDWTRHRINKGPYSGGLIKLTNQGDVEIKITGDQVSINNGASFAPTGANAEDAFTAQGFLQAMLNAGNSTLSPNETYEYMMDFSPTVAGEHRIAIDIPYVINGESFSVQAVLNGTGIQTVLTSTDINFGNMLINDDNNPLTESAYFEAVTGEFNTTVNVTGFMLDAAWNVNEFSDPNDANEVQYFVDGTATTLPVDLDPGEVLEVRNAWFVARQPGNRQVVATPEGDIDFLERSSTWNGIGDPPEGIDLVGPEPISICVDSEGVLTALLSSQDMRIDAITLENPNDPNFTLTGVRLPDGTLLTPDQSFTLNGTAEINVRYAPSAAGNHSNRIIVNYTLATNENEVISVGISSSALLFEASTALAADIRGDNQARITPGDELEVDLNIVGNIGAEAGVREVVVTMDYDMEVLKVDLNSVRVNANVGTLVNFNPNSPRDHLFDLGNGRQELRLTVSITTDGAIPTGNLIEATFDTFLAEYHTKSFATNINAQVIVTESDYTCVTIAPTSDETGLSVVCAINLRPFVTSGITYGLSQNSPNPAAVNTAIQFSVGLEAQTTLVLRDANGDVVKTLVDARLNPGEYEVVLETADLASGTYFYSIDSGPYSETKRMVITR